MILGNIPQYKTEIETLLKDAWALYKTDVIAFHTKQWKEEDIRERSEKQWDAMQYYYAVYLCILIWWEAKRNGGIIDPVATKTKYDLVAKRKCLACKGINLDKLLEIFGLQAVAGTGSGGDGLETVEIESTLVVESDDSTSSSSNIDIKALINKANYCKIGNLVSSTSCTLTPC